jgi:uncharacterized protein (TIGR00730 family)
MTGAAETMTQRKISRVAVFCGSNVGQGDAYGGAAAALGRELAGRRIGLVFGGTMKGLMGVLADATLDAGGSAHGVITRRLLDRGHLHQRLTGHEVAAAMGVRKARMLELADACIALPGGIGTVEEMMEAWTLNQLGDVDKPVGLLDVDGFYQPFLALLWQILSGTGFPNQLFSDSWVVGFWRGRPWLAGHRIGETSLDAGLSRFWSGWGIKRDGKCVRSTSRG